MININRQIIMKTRPVGMPVLENFEKVKHQHWPVLENI